MQQDNHMLFIAAEDRHLIISLTIWVPSHEGNRGLKQTTGQDQAVESIPSAHLDKPIRHNDQAMLG